MLARTADGLFWLARYMERADYVARLLLVASHMSAARVDGDRTSEWQSALTASGTSEAFFARGGELDAGAVIDWLALSKDNPSSIRSCIGTARSNARTVRTALSTDAWEAVNGAWQDLRQHAEVAPREDAVAPFLDWCKMRSALFQGVLANTMLRMDGYHFARLGMFLERADNTARLLDVKYHVLLPDASHVGGLLDYYQWLAVLRAVNARRAYRALYKSRVNAANVAELLLLRREFPRSLAYCYGEITHDLDMIDSHGTPAADEARRQANATYAELKYGRIDELLQRGLHESLTGYIQRGDRLAALIAQGHLF